MAESDVALEAAGMLRFNLSSLPKGDALLQSAVNRKASHVRIVLKQISYQTSLSLARGFPDVSFDLFPLFRLRFNALKPVAESTRPTPADHPKGNPGRVCWPAGVAFTFLFHGWVTKVI